MGKFIRLFIIPIFLYLSSCANSSSVGGLPHISYSYDDVIDYYASWENVFSIDMPNYNIYIYSIHCAHCANLKDHIIPYALEHKNIFFIEYTKDIPIGSNADSTIGITSIDNLFIKGTPSLINITESVVTANLAGQHDIMYYLGI